MKLVRVGLDELEQLLPLFDAYREFYRRPRDSAAARSFLRARIAREEAVVYLARDEDGRARGFVLLYPSFSSVRLGPLFVLNDLFVSPEARRSGVGGALLERAREHAVASGAKALVLATAEDNATAQSVYEAHGWQRDGFYHYVLELAAG